MSVSVCVGAVLVDGDRVLLCHRTPARSAYPDVWDVPGGHVEPGETPLEALHRELAEELGVRVLATAPLADLTVPGRRLLLWRVDRWEGRVRNAAPEEHDRLGWFTPDEAVRLELALADYVPLLKRLHSAPQVITPTTP